MGDGEFPHNRRESDGEWLNRKALEFFDLRDAANIKYYEKKHDDTVSFFEKQHASTIEFFEGQMVSLKKFFLRISGAVIVAAGVLTVAFFGTAWVIWGDYRDWRSTLVASISEAFTATEKNKKEVSGRIDENAKAIGKLQEELQWHERYHPPTGKWNKEANKTP